jgi:cation diffusion facilitator family transporter
MTPSPNNTRGASSVSSATCQSCSLQYSWLTLVVNALLAVLKVAVGFMAGSKALVASALYSINDVLSGITIIVSMRVARRPLDEQHAYGYGKAEFVAIGIVSTILVGAVVYIVMHAVALLVGGVHTKPHLIVLPVTAVTLATTEYLARRGFCVARRTVSPAVHTAAEHNRADGISSVAVMIGVSAASVGIYWLDPIIAIFEAVHIVWLSGVLFGQSIRGLMDASLPPDVVTAIRGACQGVPGVLDVETLRTRHVGAYAWVDASVVVSSGIPVQQADEICASVDRAIREAAARPVRSQVKFQTRLVPVGS